MPLLTLLLVIRDTVAVAAVVAVVAEDVVLGRVTVETVTGRHGAVVDTALPEPERYIEPAPTPEAAPEAEKEFDPEPGAERTRCCW